MFIDDSNDYGEVNDDEIVEDPMLTNNVYLPKKASLKALLNQDPRVLATAIEDDRINDIYFTSTSFITYIYFSGYISNLNHLKF